jgi:hypothetical protein
MVSEWVIERANVCFYVNKGGEKNVGYEECMTMGRWMYKYGVMDGREVL